MNNDYASNEYDVVIIGAGLSGLQCAYSLVENHGFEKNKILLIEAQDYIGGRIKQTTDFVTGCKIDLGAEFIHGDNSMLNDFAARTNQPLEHLFCWAHGDGGPSEAPIGDGYGLYFISGDESKPSRLLRFDDTSVDFKSLNRNLWDLSFVDDESLDESLSMHDYLKDLGTSDDMLALAAAGFANTMACNLEELSLKQCVHWAKEEHYDKTHSSNNSPVSSSKISFRSDKLRSGSITDKVGHSDYRFKNSYACLVDYLKEGFKVVLNTPISLVDYTGDVDADGVILETASGKHVHAKRVVVTCSPHVLKNSSMLRFHPALPTEKRDALDCVSMYTATKIILTFSAPFWPKGLHGMIMAGSLVPEVWFKSETPSSNFSRNSSGDTSDETLSSTSSDDDSCGSEAAPVFMAVGYLSARFAEEAKAFSHEELTLKFLDQLNDVFSHFGSEHLSAKIIKSDEPLSVLTSLEKRKLPVPSSLFVKGLVYDWASAHPYIGGAYASPMAGKPTNYPEVLAKPLNNRVFFAGEATNEDAGACTHSALETGVRAADEIAVSLSRRSVELSS